MELRKLMSTAGEGETVTRLGLHFNLSDQQVDAILNMIVPYLDDALNRLMSSPQGLAAILTQLASGQYQLDIRAKDLFENSRILANGTGVLCLLARNEATIRVLTFIAAEGARLDAKLIRRMLPYIAIIYISALARRSIDPLQEFAQRFGDSDPVDQHSTYHLAELVLSKSPMQKAVPSHKLNRGSIKDILNTLSRVEMDEETDGHHMK